MTPPYQITSKILSQVSQIERLLGRLESFDHPKPQPQLRKSNRVKSLQGSLAIEGNSLDLEQVTALLNGKKVLAPKSDIIQILNANEAYELLEKFNPFSSQDLLQAHGLMMKDLLPNPGKWRTSEVGILKGEQVSHMAPPADRVPHLIENLFTFLAGEDHPLIKGCVFHYEFEFIHPFADGNGRIGRFWHSVLLYHFHEVFEFIPVESLIKDHQKNYYDVLEACDKAGNSTQFIEFSLEMIQKALEEFLAVYRPKASLPIDRLKTAQEHFREQWFSRKDYLALHKSISTATASRDLKTGIEQDLLLIKGAKATSRYRFSR